MSTNLFRDEIGIADVFLQLEQNLRLDVVFIIVCQTLEEIGVAQKLLSTGPVRSRKGWNRENQLVLSRCGTTEQIHSLIISNYEKKLVEINSQFNKKNNYLQKRIKLIWDRSAVSNGIFLNIRTLHFGWHLIVAVQHTVYPYLCVRV